MGHARRAPQAAAAAVHLVPGPRALVLVLIAALAWQLSPVRRSLLRGCHRSPLPPREGSLSGAAAVASGARYALCCLGTCWCLMLVMVAVPAGELAWLAGLTVLITAERAAATPKSAANSKSVADPGTATRAAAAALAVATVATLAVGGLL